MNDLATKWLKERKSREEVVDQIILEQFLKTLPDDIRVYIRERSPKTSEEAAKVADDYLQARKEVISRDADKRGGDRSSGRRCHRCGKLGHLAKECQAQHLVLPQRQEKVADHSAGKNPKKDLKDIECYNCHRKGHYSSNCPQNAMFNSERMVRCGVISEVKRRPFIAQVGVMKPGFVEGESVNDILVDSGCARTMVHQKLVPEGKVKEGEAVAMQCVHGDTVLYPVAEISLEVDGKQHVVEAAVSSTLPLSICLGTDIPGWASMLADKKEVSKEKAFAVTTRAQKLCEKRKEEEQLRKERVCEVTPKTLNEDAEWMCEMDDDLFGMSKERVWKTRKEKREERQRRCQLQVDVVAGKEGGAGEEVANMDGSTIGAREARDESVVRHGLDVSAQELKEWQASDESLKGVREAVEKCEAKEGVGFFTRDGLLYRRWIPPGRGDEEEMAVEQLVLPRQCREMVLRLAHTIPLAGHLGRDKTTRRVLQHFYWPTIHKDVAIYCRTCSSCQKVAGRRMVRAPLVPLPVISQPFESIAMDIVGPLPRSAKGNRFVLVICDYATRYPEAVPMKTIDAASVAEELVTIFSRVGIPREVLTDQGTNFTSKLLSELYRMLHIQPIRTTPYHPQTDGLVERFNQTLKMMLRKISGKEGKDWDKLLPYLLFAYREVPQASTGFSPFELLYGHQVCGPLSVLSESWQNSVRSGESVVSHVMSTREKLEQMMNMATSNLEESQVQQKSWYDQRARDREFKPGDMVLLLLPTSSNKLLAQWQGPFRVEKRVGRVDYKIEMPHRRRKRQLFHVNLLKKWEPPGATSFVAHEVDENDEFPDWRGGNVSSPTFGDQLSSSQKEELVKVLREFTDVLCAKPGQTNLVEHTIHAECKPIRQAAYRIPHAYREAVLKELQEMEESGIIEPSCSEWASPIVVAKKKDNSIRLCVDYRKLNAATPMDAYPMPRVDELLDKVGKATFVSTLDLARGYWQVPVAEKDRAKTAFITPNGLYQFCVMPFGLNGAPATFQRMMDIVIRGLESFTADYIDDIAIFSGSWEDHICHIREVMQRLRKHHLTAEMSIWYA